MGNRKSTSDNYNMISNIIQIILNYFLVYVLKLAVFIFINFTIFIKWEGTEEIPQSVFISCLAFVTTVLIDVFVLSKSVKVKGMINAILLAYVFLLLLGDGFILLIIARLSPVSLLSVCLCDFINIFCCVSPVLELIYGVISHMQVERTREYV
ncbi:MAG: hypothetical protein HDR14_13930 [Lachnospiraceae bacterium]|nr:hypothetical protein [Lachnospiraceae bacterium]